MATLNSVGSDKRRGDAGAVASLGLITPAVIAFQFFLGWVQVAGYGWLGWPGWLVSFVSVMIFTIGMVAWLSPLFILQAVVQGCVGLYLVLRMFGVL